jgi:cell division protein FtsL
MKLLKPSTFIVFAFAGLSGVALLHTSQDVQRAQDRVKTLQASIEREQEQIRMLNAEWMHLNRPERLEKLANEFLDLAPPQSYNILQEADGVFPDPQVEQPEKATAQPVVYEPPVATKSAPIKPQLKPVIKQKPKPSALKSSAQKAPKDFNAVLDSLSKNGGAP